MQRCNNTKKAEILYVMKIRFLFDIKSILVKWGIEEAYSNSINIIFGVILILLLAYLSDVIIRRIIVAVIGRIVKKTLKNTIRKTIFPMKSLLMEED